MSQAAAAREADRCQADYFRDELHHQIELLNEQSDTLRSALAAYERRREVNQKMRRIQYELRSAAITHGKLADMLAALDQRFPRRQTNLTPSH